MTLLIHIIIALSSIGFASYLLVRPSRTKLRFNYGLVAATFTSGTYLVLTTGTPLLSACTSGLLYLATVSALLALANRKLATEKNRQ
jgi:hypothetical protein